MAWWDQYPYLACDLAILAPLLAGLALCRRSVAVPALLSGLAAVPPTWPEALICVPSYWCPRRVAVLWGIGLEDALCAFGLSAVSWLFATRFRPPDMELRLAWRRLLVLGLLLGAVAIGMQIPLLALGVRAGAAKLACLALVVIVLLAADASLARLAATGAVAFGAFYAGLILAISAAFPEFLRQWNPEALWGVHVHRVPVEEFLWGVLLGAGWPAAFRFAYGAQRLAVAARRQSVRADLPAMAARI